MGIIEDGGNVRGGGAAWNSQAGGHEENNSYVGDGFVCNDGDRIVEGYHWAASLVVPLVEVATNTKQSNIFSNYIIITYRIIIVVLNIMHIDNYHSNQLDYQQYILKLINHQLQCIDFCLERGRALSIDIGVMFMSW
jgi:hypothetical protein